MTDSNGNSIKINRGTLTVSVVALIALTGWGAALYNGHEKRIRSLEVSAALTEQNTKAIMEQGDNVAIEVRAMREALIASGVKFPKKQTTEW